MSKYTIQQGATFRAEIFLRQESIVAKSISGITKSAVATVTAAAHGIPTGVEWPVWIRGVVGMSKINHSAQQVKDGDEPYIATSIGANTITIDADTADLAAYVSGGELVCYPPQDLTGCIARMHARKHVSDTDPVLSLLSTTISPDSRLIINASAGRVGIEINATDTAAINWRTATFDVEVEFPDGTVIRAVSDAFSVDKEVTRA